MGWQLESRKVMIALDWCAWEEGPGLTHILMRLRNIRAAGVTVVTKQLQTAQCTSCSTGQVICRNPVIKSCHRACWKDLVFTMNQSLFFLVSRSGVYISDGKGRKREFVEETGQTPIWLACSSVRAQCCQGCCSGTDSPAADILTFMEATNPQPAIT